MEASWSRDLTISKLDEEQQLVFGWLSVAVDKDGNPVEDSQGDLIAVPDLEHAAYDFVLQSRVAGEMHERVGVGALVESVMFTAEKCAALGIPAGALPVGWWVGFKIADPDVWAKIKSGEYPAFSIGGSGFREAA